MSGRVWEDYVCAGEGVGVGEDVRGCQGDGLACASLQGGGNTASAALACAVEGDVVVRALLGVGVPWMHVSPAFSSQV